MRSLAVLILVTLLAQGRSSFMEDMEKEVKESMEKELKAAVEPLMKEARYLRERLLAMKAHTMDLELFSVGSMDYDACAHLAETIQTATQAAWNATLSGYSLAQNVSNTVWGLINCPGLNPIRTTECFYDDLKDIRKELSQARPLIDSIRKEVHQVINTVEEEYLECVGKVTAAPETEAPKTDAPETAAPETAAPSSPSTPRHVATTTKKSWWPFG